jgi:hypothetical protein
LLVISGDLAMGEGFPLGGGQIFPAGELPTVGKGA